MENGNSIPTVTLIDRFQKKYKGTHEFSFIMGSDLIKGLHYWDNGERLINDIKCIVFLRKGFPNDDILAHDNFPKKQPVLVDEEDSLIGVISSTEIRNRIAFSKIQKKPFYSIAGLVCPSVIRYIQNEKLYQTKATAVDLVVPCMRKKCSANPGPSPDFKPMIDTVTMKVSRSVDEEEKEPDNQLNYALMAMQLASAEQDGELVTEHEANEVDEEAKIGTDLTDD